MKKFSITILSVLPDLHENSTERLTVSLIADWSTAVGQLGSDGACVAQFPNSIEGNNLALLIPRGTRPKDPHTIITCSGLWDKLSHAYARGTLEF